MQLLSAFSAIITIKMYSAKASSLNYIFVMDSFMDLASVRLYSWPEKLPYSAKKAI